jgi:glyoxylase-like metal-dependent hydrolase (beta-lactamase superfamily II)
MAEVKVLIEGYAREEKGFELASSTTTLIKENGINVIVDPGMDRERLLKTLMKEKLKPDEINYVILTHYHLDHSLLTGIFKNAKVMDNTDVYSFDGKIGGHEGRVPGTNIKIIKTPGHDMFHCSILVKDNKLGLVAIVGDVFWWRDGQEQEEDEKGLLNHKDPYVKNEIELTESRKKVLELADYVIPGHGKIFKVKK